MMPLGGGGRLPMCVCVFCFSLSELLLFLPRIFPNHPPPEELLSSSLPCCCCRRGGSCLKLVAATEEAESVMNGSSLVLCGGLPISEGGELLMGRASFLFISLESDASLPLLFSAAVAELLSAKAPADAGAIGVEGPFIAEAVDP